VSFPVVFRREAKSEFDEVVVWYEGRRAGLGREFMVCVEAVLERIKKTPEIHTIVYADVRCGLVRRFPYGIYYRLEANRVVVVAVFHGSRDPEVWQRRARETGRN